MLVFRICSCYTYCIAGQCPIFLIDKHVILLFICIIYSLIVIYFRGRGFVKRYSLMIISWVIEFYRTQRSLLYNTFLMLLSLGYIELVNFRFVVQKRIRILNWRGFFIPTHLGIHVLKIIRNLLLIILSRVHILSIFLLILLQQLSYLLMMILNIVFTCNHIHVLEILIYPFSIHKNGHI